MENAMGPGGTRIYFFCLDETGLTVGLEQDKKHLVLLP
jgi:hypothetical protein